MTIPNSTEIKFELKDCLPSTEVVPETKISKLAKDLLPTVTLPPTAPPPPRRNLWTWIKDILSSITAFFRRLFGGSEVVTPVASNAVPNIKSKIELDKIKESEDPQDWGKLITHLDKKYWLETRKKELELKFKGRTFSTTEAYALENVYNEIKGKIRFELLKVIHRNPANKADLELCLHRLGTAPALTIPAPLVNHSNNCYIDSLLQILFASKSFIELLKNTPVDPQYLNQNPEEVIKASKEADDAYALANASKDKAKIVYDKAEKEYTKAIVVTTSQEATLSAEVIQEKIKSEKELNDAQKKLDATNIPRLAANNAKTPVLNAHVVQALKNYCLGLEAGLEPFQINYLRDRFSDSVAPIFASKSLDIKNQNDATEILDVIFTALNLEKNCTLKLHEVQKYLEADNFTTKPSEQAAGPQLSFLEIQPIPIPPLFEFSNEDKEKIKSLQERYNTCMADLIDLEKALKVKTLGITTIDLERRLKQQKELEKREKTKVFSLQEVINHNYGSKKESGDPFKDVVEKYGIDIAKYQKEKNKKFLDPIGELQKIIDSNFDKPEPILADCKYLEEFGINFEKLKEKGIKDLKTIFHNASHYIKERKLTGDAPPFLVITIKREDSRYFDSLNHAGIEIPQDGKVTVKIDEKDVAYKVIGNVGKTGDLRGGHYTANANINNKWYYINDSYSSRPYEQSPNNYLTNNSRIYMLERVDE